MEHDLIFDGIRMSDYGVRVCGLHTLNGTARTGEDRTVPGRNGKLRQDDGALENRSLTYEAYIPMRLKERLPELRDLLATRAGYLRLEDTFNPEEFYQARYLGGMEVSPSRRQTKAAFTLEFDCQPQRYLKVDESGFVLASWTSGGLDPETGAHDDTGVGMYTALLQALGAHVFTTCRLVTTRKSDYANALYYYDGSQNYLGRVLLPYSDTETAEEPGEISADVMETAPAGTRYFRLYTNPADYSQSITANGRTVLWANGWVTLTNPTHQEARPAFRLFPLDQTQDMQLTLGGCTFTVSADYFTDTGHSTIGLDTQRRLAYYNQENHSRYVSCLSSGEIAWDWPGFVPGENRLRMGNVASMDIIPRWWRA